jgi:hypothetical protein
MRGGGAQLAVLVLCRGQLAVLFTALACDKARLELGGDQRVVVRGRPGEQPAGGRDNVAAVHVAQHE